MRMSTRLATLTMIFSLMAALAHAQNWSVQINNGNRFRVLTQFGGAAVLDLETSLVWERTPGTTQRPWSDGFLTTAHISCATKAVGNRYGWRHGVGDDVLKLAHLIARGLDPGQVVALHEKPRHPQLGGKVLQFHHGCRELRQLDARRFL